MNSSTTILACPLCLAQFSHQRNNECKATEIYGYGLDFRVVPRDCNRASDIACCPECSYTFRLQDVNRRVSGNAGQIVRSAAHKEIFCKFPHETREARSWIALVSILEARGLNPRDLGVLSLRGTWVARELGCLQTELELLEFADYYFDDALRRGLTKGDPGMVMYLLGEINRRRGEFRKGREMLTFLGNNPRYRYPALLLTVLIEEEDSTPYWSHHSPEQMEQQSSRFRGLFPPLRSIPPKKIEFSLNELSESAEKSDGDDRRLF